MLAVLGVTGNLDGDDVLGDILTPVGAEGSTEYPGTEEGASRLVLVPARQAQDAVQQAWLRLERSDPGGIGDLRGWLTTVVGRISLDTLRARKARREVYPGSWLPEPLVEDSADDGPEHQATHTRAGVPRGPRLRLTLCN
jgi:hypothetical protein